MTYHTRRLDYHFAQHVELTSYLLLFLYVHWPELFMRGMYKKIQALVGV
jgi:hypothetical protein